MGKIRIIAGDLARREIEFRTSSARPTLGRTRETIFQWLAPYLEDARVLDAFSGTGALAFESISRGASQAICYETCAMAVQDIKNTAHKFDIESSVLVKHTSFVESVTQVSSVGFDIIFLDPPFSMFSIDLILENLVNNCWLNSNALVYLEYPKKEKIAHSHFRVYKEKDTSTFNFKILAYYESDISR